MTDTITLPHAEYVAKMAWLRDLEDIVAAREADRNPRIPHEVATRRSERSGCVGDHRQRATKLFDHIPQQ